MVNAMHSVFIESLNFWALLPISFTFEPIDNFIHVLHGNTKMFRSSAASDFCFNGSPNPMDSLRSSDDFMNSNRRIRALLMSTSNPMASVCAEV